MIRFADDDIALTGDLTVATTVAAGASACVRWDEPVSEPGEASVLAVAPLLWGTATTGVIGMVKSGAGGWTPDELEALAVVALLFAQMQARIAAESRLNRLAERDELTGLRNRRALTAEVRYRLRAGRPGPVAALYVDLDRLKAINDHLGHAAGDVVIGACAQQLRAKAGRRAMIGRVGGDEFVVIPPGPMSAEAAETLAHALKIAMRSPVLVAGRPITRTVSIGVAVGLPGVDTSDDLLRRADHAALAVKRNGGDAVAVCHHTVGPQCTVHDDRNSGVTSAYEVQYQPEIDLRTGEIIAAQALACWLPARTPSVTAFDGAAGWLPQSWGLHNTSCCVTSRPLGPHWRHCKNWASTSPSTTSAAAN